MIPAWNDHPHKDYACQYSSMLANYKTPRTITHQDIIRWSSYTTAIFGFALILLSIFSVAMYPELRRIWYPAIVLGVLTLTTGVCGAITAYQAFFLHRSQNCLAVTFLTFGCISILYSAGVIIGSAVFFPEVLEDRTDHLQRLKSTMMTAFVLSFGFALVETVMSLRFVYSDHFDEIMDTQMAEISLPVVKTMPFLNLELNERAKCEGQGQMNGSPAMPDVRTYLCRSDDESDEEQENSPFEVSPAAEMTV